MTGALSAIHGIQELYFERMSLAYAFSLRDLCYRIILHSQNGSF